MDHAAPASRSALWLGFATIYLVWGSTYLAIRVGLGSGPGVMLMTPFLIHMARHHPGVQVSVSPGATELQLMQLQHQAS